MQAPDVLDLIAAEWRSLSPRDKLYLFNTSPKEMQETICTDWRFLAREHQMVGLRFSDTVKIVIDKSGRGGGKTREGAEWSIDETMNGGEGYRHLVSNKNFGDVKKINFEGESGLIAVLRRRGYKTVDANPKENEYAYAKGNLEIYLEGGRRICGVSGETPDGLAGHQFHSAWFDELALYKTGKEFWEAASFTIRLGDSNKRLITTTPRPSLWFKKLTERKDAFVQTSSTYDNKANLTDDFIKDMEEQFEGTRLGLQELHGQILEDNPGALWCPKRIEELRVDKDGMPQFKRVILAIDPAVSSNEGSDETGMIVAALGMDGEAYILQDLTVHKGLDKCLADIDKAYRDWGLDRIVAEVNQGGDLVERFIRTLGIHIPYKGVRATRGKVVRAEPVAALYEQGRVHHVGLHGKLEDQMCAFSRDMKKSPDRVDALVWALTELMLDRRETAIVFV